MNYSRSLLLTTVCTVMCLPGAYAQNPGAAFFEDVEITVEQVGDNLYVLFGYGGNIGVQIGDQGAMLVDTQFPELVPKIRAAIESIGSDSIEFAINTHWHYDHAEGNLGFGPQGVWFVAHSESSRRLAQDNILNVVPRPPFPQPAYRVEARPTASFDDSMQMHFNGELIELMHFGPAHTAGDTAVFFRSHNAVHMGDVFLPRGYPFVDADNGGSLEGMIAFCRAVLTQLDENSVVIPGHGPVTDAADLRQYVQMLVSVRNRLAALIEDGATLDQVIAARPTQAWDEFYGNPAGFINRAYTSMTQ